MNEIAQELADASARQDMRRSDLGDQRREKRALLIVERLSERPEASIPEAMGS